ncbi:MAG: DUF1254 domain-containing protein [Thiohalomonadales bacterium]
MKLITHKTEFKHTALLTLISIVMSAQVIAAPKYAAKVPANIQTPNEVNTKLLGKLKYFDGTPTQETVTKAYDFIDTARAAQAFLTGIPIASIYAFLEGLKEVGAAPGDLILFENLMDARTLLLTPNTTTPYAFAEVNLKAGPMIVVIPPMVLGGLDNEFFLHVNDFGITGTDAGKGGKYLIIGPGYKGKIPKGYNVYHSKTYRNWLFLRTFVKNGDVAASTLGLRKSFNIYPLAQASKPPEQKVINVSGKQFNTIHANNFDFFNEINEVIQYEPADALDPETVGLFAAIGIKKGQPFAPDKRMKKILTDGVAIGNATARANLFAPRNKAVYFYPGKRQWFSPFAVVGYDFYKNGERTLDLRTMFHYYATGITPAMSVPRIGKGSVYEIGTKDKQGNYLDGGKNYVITLPAPVPAANFWSFIVYDGQTRSILETDQKFGGVDNKNPNLKTNKDGSYTVYFGPKVPKGHEGNWVQTMPNKSYNVLLRIYGPLKPWFDRSWMPGDFELIK